MDEKRLKIAESNFKNYLDQRLLNKVPFEGIIFQTYFNNALESLKVAEELLKNKTSPLWVVVTSYYSMFYMASAYIYKRGYKAKGEIVHQVINEALIILARHNLEKHFIEEYEEEKEKALFASGNLLKDYELEKAKRASFQYETTETIKEVKARTSLERAKNFIAVMRRLIDIALFP